MQFINMNVRPATENDNANCSVSLSKNALPHEIQDRLVASKSMDSTVRANCTLAHSPKAKRIVLGNHNRVKLIMEAMKFIYREPECFLFSRKPAEGPMQCGNEYVDNASVARQGHNRVCYIMAAMKRRSRNPRYALPFRQEVYPKAKQLFGSSRTTNLTENDTG